jgi:hypothetical protein
MVDQVSLAQRAEKLDFSALWFRDVPLRDPSFGDLGQVFDPWVYLGFMAATLARLRWVPRRSSFRSAIPYTPPRPQPASISSVVAACCSAWLPVTVQSSFQHSVSTRSNAVACSANISQVQLTSFVPLTWSGGRLEGAELIPKPTTAEIPFFVTGHSRQTLEWIARSSHGWITYPRAPQAQQMMVERWRTTVRAECGDVFKPFTQSLYVDLTDNPQTPPRPIHLGYQLGRNHLIALLHTLQERVGVNHVIINLKYGQRPADEVIEELGEFVLPDFAMPT